MKKTAKEIEVRIAKLKAKNPMANVNIIHKLQRQLRQITAV